MTVRAIFQAAKVAISAPPYDTIHLKVFYPAELIGFGRKSSVGAVPADTQQSPFKVVVFFNGLNCGPELYKWLAIQLAEHGLAVVTFSWVAENLPGFIALTPGIDVKQLSPETYGMAPTSSALPAILHALEQVNAEGVLAGMLDLEHVILGGHSAGGRVAIENASQDYFPQVVAAFAYGSHTAAGPQIGFEPGQILPLPDSLPLLLMGGANDGVIANSSKRYGVTWDTPSTPIVRTFDEAIAGGRNDSYLAILEGANHFSVVDPFDTTTGSALLDFPETKPKQELQTAIATSICQFIDAHVRGRPMVAEQLKQTLSINTPLVAIASYK